MPTLNWNEIRTRAAQFAARWADEQQENAEAQTFWNEFLQVYGIDRRRVAAFERRVDGLATESGRGRIDLLWPGLFMAEHKTRGRDLKEATDQALAYVEALEEHERPQWVAVSDFARVRLHEVSSGTAQEFVLSQFPQRVEIFGFLIGRQLRHLTPGDPVNIQAAQQMGRLHDLLGESGYTGHALELLLVRLLFLLFGDDTGLWDERGLFQDVLDDHTRKDGEDLGAVLGRLFQVLNTPPARRQSNLPAWLGTFPYVNGELFSERIDLADFSPQMRRMLLEACALDWGQVSPAIFGNMFQAAMDRDLRAELGAHYTSEENILKVLGPLFLDDLKARREAARGSHARIQAFLDLLPRLRFLDPACGSGNFLLVAFRELRRLELSALVELMNGRQVLDIETLLRVNVEQFYGIEFDEFPSRIARVALWLADHQMNLEASQQLGQNFVNLPLVHAAHVRHGDALEVDWAEHLQLTEDGVNLSGVFILGNPPFVGSYLMEDAQKAQVRRLFAGNPEAGVLDFVAAWYVKAAALMQHIAVTWPALRTATSLVSTNSITQGEQVPPLWTEILINRQQVITAAHQTFKWMNDAPGVAGVSCIIVQFQPARTAPTGRRLFTYADPRGIPTEQAARIINAYLLDGLNLIVYKSRRPLVAGVQELVYGNKPVDGGHLIFHTRAELDEFLTAEPLAKKYIRRLLDAQDFLRGAERWCLWLVDAGPDILQMPRVMARVRLVREAREKSRSPIIQRFAATPTLFTQRPHTGNPYLAVPAHTSERRDYIPFGFLDGDTVINNALFMVPDADILTFGVMTSRAHMNWVELTSGRIRSDYRYNKELTYNTFPWPDRTRTRAAQLTAIEHAARAVLDARTAIQERHHSSLSQMYDPLTMPADLRQAHRALDRTVDAIYGIRATDTDAQRQAILLTAYQQVMPRRLEPPQTRTRAGRRA